MSTFGRLFRVTTFGESHCTATGAVIDGVPARMSLSEADIQTQLSRRRPGQSALTTSRKEADRVSILSGVECGITLGTPIAVLIPNEDQRPKDYTSATAAAPAAAAAGADTKQSAAATSSSAATTAAAAAAGSAGAKPAPVPLGVLIPRPSHGDYTYQHKYGVRATSGGGRASARETAARVAAGAIAERWLREKYNIEVIAWVSGVGAIKCSERYESDSYHVAAAPAASTAAPIGPAATAAAAAATVATATPAATAATAATAAATTPFLLTRDYIDRSAVRCPDPAIATAMAAHITAVRDAHDSVGGVVTCVIRPITGGGSSGSSGSGSNSGGGDSASAFGLPVGWGEPVFDKLEALLAHAMLSIPATKGFEIGSGFAGTAMRGSQHNDPFLSLPRTNAKRKIPDSAAAQPAAEANAAAAADHKSSNSAAAASAAAPPTAAAAAVATAASDSAKRTKPNSAPTAAAAAAAAAGAFPLLSTATNHSGGVQAGLSNGACIVCRIAFKPPATIGVAQQTVDFYGEPVQLSATGRHDPCVVPRAVPIVEAMAALVLADVALQHESQLAASSVYPLIPSLLLER